MIQRVVLTALSFLLSVSYGFAQNQEFDFQLNSDNNFKDRREITTHDIVIMVEANQNYDGESHDIHIQVENSNSRNGLVVFKDNYDEKDKKKLKNNDFYEVYTENNSLKANTLPCVLPPGNGLRQNVFINYNETQSLPTRFPLKVKENEPLEVKLPIYTCDVYTKKNKVNKLKLTGYSEYSLSITVDLGPDTVYEYLAKRYDDYAKKISAAQFWFCPYNKKHQQSIQEQIDHFSEEGRTIKTEILERSKMFQRNSSQWKQYHALQDRIDSVYRNATDSSNFKLCSRHQTCSNCNRSYSDCNKNCKHGKNCECGVPPKKCACGKYWDKCKTRCNGKHYRFEPVKEGLNDLAKKIDNRKKNGMAEKEAQSKLNELKKQARSIIEKSERNIALSKVKTIQNRIDNIKW